jgi:hypothetical protein
MDSAGAAAAPHKCGNIAVIMAERLLNIFFGIIAALILVSVIRSRWVQRRGMHDIQPSEISPDLTAGQELLDDALRAERGASSL